MEGQVALITGGGGGIGSATARRLASAGARVVITYNSDAAKADVALKSLAGEGHWATQASVTDSERIAWLAGEVRDRYGRLDLLVNNAGLTTPVPHSDLDGLSD